jgi:hypothetical protein
VRQHDRGLLAAGKCSPHASAHHSARALFTPSSQVPRARSARGVTTALVAALGDERYVDRECGPTRDAGGRESLRAVLLSRAELWVQPHLLHLRLPSQLSSESPACTSRSPPPKSTELRISRVLLAISRVHVGADLALISRRPSSLFLGHTAVLGPEGSHQERAPLRAPSWAWAETTHGQGEAPGPLAPTTAPPTHGAGGGSWSARAPEELTWSTCWLLLSC